MPQALHALLPRLPPSNHKTPANQHHRTQPPQARQALTKYQRAGNSRREEVGRRVEHRHVHGRRGEGEGAREQAPHDGVEEQVEAEAGGAHEELEKAAVGQAEEVG